MYIFMNFKFDILFVLTCRFVYSHARFFSVAAFSWSVCFVNCICCVIKSLRVWLWLLNDIYIVFSSLLSSSNKTINILSLQFVDRAEYNRNDVRFQWPWQSAESSNAIAFNWWFTIDGSILFNFKSYKLVHVRSVMTDWLQNSEKFKVLQFWN